MRNTDLYRVKQGVDKCSALVNVADIEFAYSMAKIESEVVAELRCIEKCRKPAPEKYAEYLVEREQLDIDDAVTMPDGTFQTLGDRLLIKNPHEHAKKVAELDKKYKDVIDQVKKNAEEFEDYLLQDCKVQISKLAKGCIPAQLSVEQMKFIFPVIE